MTRKPVSCHARLITIGRQTTCGIDPPTEINAELHTQVHSRETKDLPAAYYPKLTLFTLSCARRRELRERHAPEALKQSRESHEANKAKLKSDLKKTTAFTKKVKALSEDQRASLDKDLDNLNLSRYVSEIVDAVAENRLKNADVSVAVHLCCLMHQRCVVAVTCFKVFFRFKGGVRCWVWGGGGTR